MATSPQVGDGGANSESTQKAELNGWKGENLSVAKELYGWPGVSCRGASHSSHEAKLNMQFQTHQTTQSEGGKGEAIHIQEKILL